MLVDALRGEKYVWFRLTIRGGGGETVEDVSCQRKGGAPTNVDEYMTEHAGQDLQIVVQLDREQVDGSTRLFLKIKGGPRYKFSLGAPTILRFVEGLF